MADNIDVENMDPQGEVTSDDKLWAMLAYIFSPLIPIIIFLLEDKKNLPFIRAHNAQALVWGIVIWVVSTVTSFLACVPGILLWLVGVYWGWKAYQGETVDIPVITDFVKQQGWA